MLTSRSRCLPVLPGMGGGFYWEQTAEVPSCGVSRWGRFSRSCSPGPHQISSTLPASPPPPPPVCSLLPCDFICVGLWFLGLVLILISFVFTSLMLHHLPCNFPSCQDRLPVSTSATQPATARPVGCSLQSAQIILQLGYLILIQSTKCSSVQACLSNRWTSNTKVCILKGGVALPRLSHTNKWKQHQSPLHSLTNNAPLWMLVQVNSCVCVWERDASHPWWSI